MEPSAFDNSRPILPPELWNEILKLLPAMDQRTCLHLSRSFHEVTQRLIFSHTKIYMGVPCVPPWRADEKHATPAELTQMTEQAERAQDLLRHITHNSEFAHIIRELTIHACALGGQSQDVDIFVKAFQNLTRLKTFAWRCSRPPLQPQLLEAIIKASGPTLTCVRIPATWQCVAQLAQLPNVHRLELVRNRYEDGEEAETPSNPAALDPDIFKTNGSTLRGLLLRGLDRADFLVAPLVSQCFDLTSLSIHITTYYAAPLLKLMMLGNMQNTLPNLASLRLIYASGGMAESSGGMDAVASFLKNRRNLVRLDITPDTEAKYRSTIDPTPVLEVLRGLTALRTLGIGMAILYYRDEDLQTFDQYLPDGLSALLLLFDSLSALDTCIDADGLVDLIKKRPHLRYMHVWPPERDYSEECYPRLLEQPLSMLQLVGWRRQLSYVLRDQSTGAIAHTEPWPAEKVLSGTVEDFGCEDWRWLLSAHVTEGPIETSEDDLWE
ncbi:hypothetical protein C2E23DRAFT_572187 [Lenzites betulinus]|nr:hypothetical protein C2E23DRAFT_572187 [Lenzites betulinus]